VTAIIGGLGAATLWAIATLASSRSSRMLGSRVVLAWVMIVGAIAGVPMLLVSGVPTEIPPDAPFLLLVNAWWEPLEVRLPAVAGSTTWSVAVDTTDPPAGDDVERRVEPAAPLQLGPRSLILLRGEPLAT